MKRAFRIAVATLLFWVVAGSSAWAGSIRLRIEDLNTQVGVILTDGGPGDQDSGEGSLAFVGAVGNFSLNVVIGTSTPGSGIGDYGLLRLSGIHLTGGGSLQVTIEQSDYVGPLGPLEATAAVSGNLFAPPGSFMLVQSWASGGNAVPLLGADQPVGTIPAMGGIPADSTPLWTAPGNGFGQGAISSTSSVLFDNGTSDTFALFTQLQILFLGDGQVNFSTDLQVADAAPAAVPEPASLLLLSTGMAGVAVLRRRKRSSTRSL